MTVYLVIERQQYSENTSQYGYGDFPTQIEYVAAVVSGDTLRKAQFAARKALPGIRFGGMFSPDMVPLNTTSARRYLKPADYRLHIKAGDRHRHAVAVARVMLERPDHVLEA